MSGQYNKMKSFQVEIPDIQSSFPLTASEEENSFLSTFFMMVKGSGGDDGFSDLEWMMIVNIWR